MTKDIELMLAATCIAINLAGVIALGSILSLLGLIAGILWAGLVISE